MGNINFSTSSNIFGSISGSSNPIKNQSTKAPTALFEGGKLQRPTDDYAQGYDKNEFRSQWLG